MALTELRVQASNDDTWVYGEPDFTLPGQITSSETYFVGNDPSVMGNGSRFTPYSGNPVPAGAVITSAIVYYPGSTNSAAGQQFELFGEKGQNPPDYTVGATLADRTLTSASTVGSSDSWLKGGNENSLDVTSIVQEIVDDPGYTEGDNFAIQSRGLTHTGFLAAYSFDGGYNARLVIEWSMPGGSTSLESRVSQSTDDVEELLSTGGIDLISSDLELGTESGEQLVGIRFTNITVPPGDNVDSAVIDFVVDEDTVVNEVTFRIWGAAVANPGTFTGANAEVSSLPKTATFVDWSPPTWDFDSIGTVKTTPDLSPILQEIIGHPDWASGNSVIFIIGYAPGSAANRRVVQSYDKSAANAALLRATHSTPAVAAVVDDSSHLTKAESAAVDAAVNAAQHNHTAELAGIVVNVDDSSHDHTAEDVFTIPTAEVDRAHHSHTAERLRPGSVSVSDALHEHRAENTGRSFGVDSARHRHRARQVTLGGPTRVQDGQHSVTTDIAIARLPSTVISSSHRHRVDSAPVPSSLGYMSDPKITDLTSPVAFISVTPTISISSETPTISISSRTPRIRIHQV